MMWVRAAGVLVVTMAICATAAADELFTRIRTAEPLLGAAIAGGMAQSPTFRRLVDRVNASDLVVHVVFARDTAHADGADGRLCFVVRAGGVRYVRVSIAPTVHGDRLIAILGHELQHAVEVADAPSVTDSLTMAAWYEVIGERHAWTPREEFDTARAVDAGEQVFREVRAAALANHLVARRP